MVFLSNDKNWKLETDEHDKQTILLYYPQDIVINEISYIKPVIRLYIGARGKITSKEDKVIFLILQIFVQTYLNSKIVLCQPYL